MEFETILNNLKNKIYKPIYLFYGEEAYFIDELTNYIQNNVLSEAEKAFNLNVLYGNEVTATEIIEISRRYPMASNLQIVIVKEAQDIKDFNKLEIYASNPLHSTILVLSFKNTKTIDKRLKVTKAIIQNGEVFESKKLYERQIYSWINSYLKNENLTIHPDALRLFYESVGSDITRIVHELKKITLTQPKGTQVDQETVASLIGVNREFNIFELQKAISERNIPKIYAIFDYFCKNSKSNPLLVTTIRLFDYFLKILKIHALKTTDKKTVAAEIGVNIYFVDEYITAYRNYSLSKTIKIISYLRDAHMKTLGVGANAKSEKDLSIDLIYKIIH